MDFNDLNARLKRIYAALGERYELDISSNIVDAHTSFEDGRFEHHTTFGSNDPEKNQNTVMGAVHLIGSLKDVIKRKLSASNANPILYEQIIDNTQALCLITDLDNKDKHGDPLTHRQRSGKDPRIINIQQVLHGQGKTRASFTTNFNTGKTTLNSLEGDVKIELVADVVDSNGKLIMPLDKMLGEALKVIEGFLTQHDLL